MASETARAEDDDSGSLGEQPAEDGAPRETAENEFKLGPFVVDPRFVVSQGYEDNIFSTRNDKVGDFITVLSPALTLELDSDEHAFSLGGGADVARYLDNDSEDYEDYWFFGDGRYDISKDSNVFGGGRYTFDHEGRESPDDVAGAEPTTFEDIEAYAGTFNQFGDLSTRLGGTFQRLDFDDVSGGPGVTINNDDRDRNLFEAGARVGYRVYPGIVVFAQGAADIRRYDASADDLGFDRDSTGFNLAGGVRAVFADGINAEAFVGALHQDYEGNDLDSVTEPDFGARLRWNPMDSTTVVGLLDRTVEETTLANASSYLSTTVALAVEQDLRPDLEASLDIAYTENDYEGVNRVDHLVGVGVAVRYFFHPNFFVGTDFRFQQRDSNISTEDYDNSQVFLRLGTSLQPHHSPNQLQTASTEAGSEALASSTGGFFAGAQGGFGALFSALDGPRGPGGQGGTLSADFGDHGATVGAYAGYEVEFDGWNLALELEGETSDTDWDHDRSPGGRFFSVEKNETIGGALRVGRRLGSGALIYGRAGAVGTSFTTKYSRGGTSFDQDETLPGFRFGGGVEVPLDSEIFWRLDYTYTAYEDYDIRLPGGKENFSNSETLMRTGIGFRFGGPRSAGADEEAAGHDFSGFYGGAQGGYGAINTENKGPRQAGSTLSVDRGGHGGTGGGFAGFGHNFYGLYLGVEGEGEVSYANWDIQRDPNGRAYSVDKKWSYGATGRVGYVVADRALFYGRAGAVRTRFNTGYTFRANSVDQDDTLTGLRAGGGIEVAAGENLFVRLDYTYTDYDDYKVNYAAGIDSFDTSESLFRFGLGYRF